MLTGFLCLPLNDRGVFEKDIYSGLSGVGGEKVRCE